MRILMSKATSKDSQITPSGGGNQKVARRDRQFPVGRDLRNFEVNNVSHVRASNYVNAQTM